ncbi:MAG TPA: amidohydrolase family protein [Candidatus Sulfotelmatobacter sp.]|jgi:L-fuconolactonase
MHIDAHQHFWIYSPAEYAWIDDSMSALRKDFLPEDLKPELESNGFQGSIAVQARQTLEETRWLLELAARHRPIVGVVGWADLRSAGIRSQLKSLTSNRKLAGVRHVVQSEPDDRFLLQPEFLRGVAALEDFGLAYDILIYTKHLPVAAEFVGRFPRQRFVLDHLAKPPIKSGQVEVWADGIKRLAEFPNVFCKLSGLVTEADWKSWRPEQIAPFLDVAFASFGADRLMIGSDWPVCLVAATYTQAIRAVNAYLLEKTPAIQEGVLGGNARRFYRLADTPIDV